MVFRKNIVNVLLVTTLWKFIIPQKIKNSSIISTVVVPTIEIMEPTLELLI